MQKVGKVVPPKREILKDISLSFFPGAKIGVLGLNGAGKSTLLRIMAGIDIEINGEARAQPGIKIGYLPQEASIFRRLTVTENIMGILQTRKELTQPQRDEKLNTLLEEFHITHIRNSKGMSLSGGERRRVEIARALATEPKFILLDEPFAGVDPISVIDIKNIIQQLRDRGLGVLITDHNVRETLDVCEHSYIVSHGEIIAVGTQDEILANDHVKRVYLGEEFKL